MQAIILAAGMGARLKPLTDAMPKCLTEVDGRPLLINALDLLERAGIAETVIVTGHLADAVRARAGNRFGGMRLRYIHNPDYAATNNVYSLALALEAVGEDCLLLECDLFFRMDVLKAVLGGTADCEMLVSPYDPATMDGTLVRAGADGRVRELIVKMRQGPDFDAAGAFKTVNIYRFSRAFFLEKFAPAIRTYVATQSRRSYYELVLGSLIYFGNDDIRAIAVDAARWAEVDTPEDLALAERKFARRAPEPPRA